MDKFLKYFENDQFVRWVLKPTKELDDFWESYLKNNKSEQEEVELARLLVLQLQSKKEAESETEVIELFSKIVEKLDKDTRKPTFRRIGISILKYAAVGLIFFLLGISGYYYQKTDLVDQITQQYPVEVNHNNSHLILADGTNVAVSEKKSKIEYQNNGEIVINTIDTIKASTEQKAENLNQLIVPFGKISSIKLPDGTLACLSAGSRLFYPSKFDKKKREVHLIGEGFFEVAHNAQLPFIVKTTGLDVQVLGTKFNLSAFPGDNVVETVLVEGKVRLKEKGFNLLKSEVILEPNQRAEYNLESGKTNIAKVNVANYVSWRNGFLEFESEELNRVIKRLERYYNIKIQWSDPTLGVKTITGKLSLKEDVECVLNVLANSSSTKIEKIKQSTYVLK